jgi:hypothetical protein
MPYNIPGQRSKKDSPLDILHKRLASGEITNEEYNEKKRMLQNDSSIKESHNRKVKNQAYDVVYGLGFIGAAIFFIQHSVTFWACVIGIIKAIFWPVMIVYKLLEFLKM